MPSPYPDLENIHPHLPHYRAENLLLNTTGENWYHCMVDGSGDVIVGQQLSINIPGALPPLWCDCYCRGLHNIHIAQHACPHACVCIRKMQVIGRTELLDFCEIKQSVIPECACALCMPPSSASLTGAGLIATLSSVHNGRYVVGERGVLNKDRAGSDNDTCARYEGQEAQVLSNGAALDQGQRQAPVCQMTQRRQTLDAQVAAAGGDDDHHALVFALHFTHAKLDLPMCIRSQQPARMQNGQNLPGIYGAWLHNMPTSREMSMEK